MKWLYVFSRFELSIPDRNRHAPDRLIPFPISRNTDFVFPSDFSVPVSVPDQKIQLREWLRSFPTVPDRFHPLPMYMQYAYACQRVAAPLPCWQPFCRSSLFLLPNGWLAGVDVWSLCANQLSNTPRPSPSLCATQAARGAPPTLRPLCAYCQLCSGTVDWVCAPASHCLLRCATTRVAWHGMACIVVSCFLWRMGRQILAEACMS